jgi:hypothetical protein
MSYLVYKEDRDGKGFAHDDTEITELNTAIAIAERYRGMAVSVIIINAEQKEVSLMQGNIETFRSDLDDIVPGWKLKDEK